MIDEIKDFIKRCNQPEFQNEVIKHYKYGNWLCNKSNRENRQKHREKIRIYSNTEKGKYACSKRNAKRRKFMSAACEDLTLEEKKLIGRFYINCPKGYEVDHIIPVSRGGKHRLSNLQYLTKEENSKKGCRILEEIKPSSHNVD